MPKKKSRKHRQPHRRPIPAGHTSTKQSPHYKMLVMPDGTSRPTSYRPGRLKVNTEALLAKLDTIDPGLTLALLPAALWLDWLPGHTANVCVDACLTLKRAYALLGIESRILPVSVTVGRSDGPMSVYCPNPTWNGSTFHGHCVMWLPDTQRLVDHPAVSRVQARQRPLGRPSCGRRRRLPRRYDRRHSPASNQRRRPRRVHRHRT
jgi:hypothetical protein